jgi:lipid-A-disaccharide synthase
MVASTAPLFFLVAGEPSGDALGARLISALEARTGGRVRFAGVGGPAMAAAGMESLFPQSDLSVMGLLEVLPSLPRILRRLAETEAAVRRLDPAVVLTIDSPGFGLRLQRRLARNPTTPRPLRVHWVAPSVWAWRPGRARKIAAYLDHLLALLPFEPPWFERWGLGCSFVGHPVVEAARGDRARGRDLLAHAPDRRLMGLLPGSRRGEVARMLPPLLEAAGILRREDPELAFVIPTVPNVADAVRAMVGAAGVPVSVVEPAGAKPDIFAAMDAALATSGTVTLELSLAGVPCAAAYRVNALTAAIVRRLIKVRYASLTNILLDRPVIPELMQEAATPAALAAAGRRLLSDAAGRAEQAAAGDEVARMLGRGGPSPSERAADVLLGLMRTDRPG